MRYRKRPVAPVEVEVIRVNTALRYAEKDWYALPVWLRNAYEAGNVIFHPGGIDAFGGRVKGLRGDLLVYENGEFDAYDPREFAQTYEAVEEKPAAVPMYSSHSSYTTESGSEYPTYDTRTSPFSRPPNAPHQTPTPSTGYPHSLRGVSIDHTGAMAACVCGAAFYAPTEKDALDGLSHHITRQNTPKPPCTCDSGVLGNLKPMGEYIVNPFTTAPLEKVVIPAKCVIYALARRKLAESGASVSRMDTERVLTALLEGLAELPENNPAR